MTGHQIEEGQIPSGNTVRIPGRFDTTVSLLAAVAEARPETEAFVDGTTRLTFAGLASAAGGVAARLAGAGVGHGDVVCLALPSSVDYAVCYHAAMRLGAITSGVNPRLGPLEVARILDRARPVVTVCAEGWVTPAGSAPGHVIEVSSLREWWFEEAPPAAPVAPSDPVAVVWTSGTTGVPKGAVFDHANLAAVAAGAGDLSRPGDRRLSPLPFAHVGFMTRPWDELVNAITTVIVPSPWKAADAIRLIDEERVTVAQGVPTQWRLVLAHPDFDRADHSSLRVAGTGASSVPPELVRELRSRLGCPVVVGYASTETAIITRSRIGDTDEDVARTVGTPSDGVEVCVVDDEGRPVPPGRVGRVRCRSAAAMRGYWGDDEATAAARGPDGWITTGDLGHLDDRGYLTLAGRQAEMYIRGGYNVYPVEVEAVLSDHPAVAQAAVVAAPDPVLGEIGVAVVVPVAGAAPERDELRAWCKARLAGYKAPDIVRLVEALPLTAMSKVDKRALADAVGAHLARGGAT